MKTVGDAWRKLRTGIISGSADNDPSGIATYSQIGATLGFLQLWTALYIFPLLLAVQEASARIGAVTGKGLAATIKNHYSKPILYSVVSLLFIANVINIGADIGAMAAATQLLFPVNFAFITILFAVGMVTIEILVPYKSYADVLKFLCLSLLAYPLTLLFIKTPFSPFFSGTR